MSRRCFCRVTIRRHVRLLPFYPSGLLVKVALCPSATRLFASPLSYASPPAIAAGSAACVAIAIQQRSFGDRPRPHRHAVPDFSGARIRPTRSALSACHCHLEGCGPGMPASSPGRKHQSDGFTMPWAASHARASGYVESSSGQRLNMRGMCLPSSRNSRLRPIEGAPLGEQQ